MREYAWVPWDLLMIAVLYGCIWICAARGLMRTVVSFLGYFFAAAAAWFLGPAIARLLYENVVHGLLRSTLVTSLSGVAESGSGDLLGALPGAIVGLMGGGAKAVSALRPQETAELLADAVIETALRDPVMSLLESACFLLIFVLAAYLIRQMANLLTEVYRIPVIGTVNTVMGGIVGVFQGVLVLFILAFFLRAASAFSAGEWKWLNDRIISETYILRIFYFTE